MRPGVLYHSFVEPSGYGLAGIAYVRALVNAGVPVRWVPVRRIGDDVVPVTPSHPLPLALAATDDESLADLPALLAATSRPIAVDTVVAHTVPEHWPSLFRPDMRNVGMTVWETDRLPAHWKPLLDAADRVIVPCVQNRDVFVAAGVETPVHVVPHVRRHAWNAFTPAEIRAARARFALDDARFVFYAINAWDPRKALPALLRAFVRAFRADEGVALVLKTGPDRLRPAAVLREGADARDGAGAPSTRRPTRSTATRRRSACCPTSSADAASTCCTRSATRTSRSRTAKAGRSGRSTRRRAARR